MLNLQSRVHFHEIKRVIFADQELDRTRADIIDRLRRCDRSIAHGAARGFGEIGGRRLFHHFLVPALDTAVSIKQRDTLPLLVKEHLNLYVTRLLK